LAFATTASLHPFLPPHLGEARRGRKCSLVSLYMTEHQPTEIAPARACHHSNRHSQRWDGVRKTLVRHSFSELLALAGELLHIPSQISTFMTTVPLLPASSILKRGSDRVCTSTSQARFRSTPHRLYCLPVWARRKPRLLGPRDSSREAETATASQGLAPFLASNGYPLRFFCTASEIGLPSAP